MTRPGDRVTAPVGDGAGRIFRVASLPVDLSVGADYTVGKPEVGARGRLSTTLTLVF